MKAILKISLVASTILLTSIVHGYAYELYMSPNGNDSNPGNVSRPVASLERVHDILVKEDPDEDVVIYVVSDQGSYEISNLVWTYYKKDWKTIITSYPEGINAEFTASDYKGNAFITFDIMNGEPSNIEISNITVKDCSCRTFLFRGDPEDEDGWNGYNTIRGCKFVNIGNYNFPAAHVVYSVIGFVNSRNNTIEDCVFENIKNHTAATYPQKRIELKNPEKDKNRYPNILEYAKSNLKGAGYNPNLPIIGIYYAHNCDSNLVINNEFNHVKGDVVRIRNNSNNLVFSKNTTEVSGWNAVVTAWYRTEKDTAEAQNEKPSYNVKILDNQFNGNWLYGEPTIYGDLITKEIFQNDSMNGSRNIIIKGNVTRSYSNQ